MAFLKPHDAVTRPPIAIIAEDDASTRESLAGHLRRRGYSVYACPNGEQAVQKYESLIHGMPVRQPALLLVDQELGEGETGIDVLKHPGISADRVMKKMMITGHPDIRSQAEGLGAAFYVKPAGAELLTAVSRLIKTTRKGTEERSFVDEAAGKPRTGRTRTDN